LLTRYLADKSFGAAFTIVRYVPNDNDKVSN